MIRLGRIVLDCPAVMGVLNVTPDSFSDGGHFVALDDALRQAEQMVAAGAAILDVGGESTRPGAAAVDDQQELDRVLPVIEALVANQVNIPISIDTYKPKVMRAAIDAGASIVNDVRALQEEGAVAAVASTDVGICLMHMQGKPQTMQDNPHYSDVVNDISDFLLKRVKVCEDAGINQNRLLLDPGFGFGKTREHNITLVRQLDRLAQLDIPLLVGLSRKSVLGQVTGNDVDARLYASIAAAVISTMKGAKVIRVHDVKATVEALKVVTAVLE